MAVQDRVHNKAGVRVVEEEVAVVIATEVVVQILEGGQQEEGMVENVEEDVVEVVVDSCQKSVRNREFLITKSDYRYSAE